MILIRKNNFTNNKGSFVAGCIATMSHPLRRTLVQLKCYWALLLPFYLPAFVLITQIENDDLAATLPESSGTNWEEIIAKLIIDLIRQQLHILQLLILSQLC